MANGYGGASIVAFLNEDGRHGFADDIAAAKNNGFGAGNRDAATEQQFVDARRGAGAKAGIVAKHEFANIDGIEAIDVLLRGDGSINFGFGNVFGQRRLHQNSMNGRSRN